MSCWIGRATPCRSILEIGYHSISCDPCAAMRFAQEIVCNASAVTCVQSQRIAANNGVNKLIHESSLNDLDASKPEVDTACDTGLRTCRLCLLVKDQLCHVLPGQQLRERQKHVVSCISYEETKPKKKVNIPIIYTRHCCSIKNNLLVIYTTLTPSNTLKLLGSDTECTLRMS